MLTKNCTLRQPRDVRDMPRAHVQKPLHLRVRARLPQPLRSPLAGQEPDVPVVPPGRVSSEHRGRGLGVFELGG